MAGKALGSRGVARRIEQRKVCRARRPHSASSRVRGHVQRSAKAGAEQQAKGVPKPPRSNSVGDVASYIWRVGTMEAGVGQRLLGATGCMVLAKVLGLAVPFLWRRTVEALECGSVALTVWFVIAGGAAKGGANVISEVRSSFFMPAAQAIARRIELTCFEHVLRLDPAFHLEQQSGSLARAIDRGTKSVTMIFRAGLFTFVPTLLEFATVCAVLARTFSYRSALAVSATFTAYVSWTIFISQMSTARRKKANALDSKAAGRAVEALSKYETVAAFNNAAYERRRYDHLVREYQRASLSAERASCTLNAGQAVILALGLSTVLVDVVYTNGSVGELVMANGLLLQVWTPLNFLGFYYREMRQSLADMERMFSMLATKSKVTDGHLPLPPSARGVSLDLRGVSFSYGAQAEGYELVLKDITFSASPGESIGIVGASGSGKSTLLKLILRSFDCTDGEICIDGVNVQNLRLADLRGASAVVPQEAGLFNDTLAENVAYGRPGAGRGEVEEAVEMAQLDECVRRLAYGLETEIGDNGFALSGGERQRVAIARAFLRRPRLLLCDEATSALDSATEQDVMASLRELSQGRTSLFVAHRLGTVRHCDRILVMSQGRVVEEGAHDSLVELGGLYASMWRQQMEGKPVADSASNGEGQTSGTVDSGRGAIFSASSSA